MTAGLDRNRPSAAERAPSIPIRPGSSFPGRRSQERSREARPPKTPAAHVPRAGYTILPERVDGSILAVRQARSSVVEHYLDMVGVAGSIPAAPTSPGLAVFPEEPALPEAPKLGATPVCRPRTAGADPDRPRGRARVVRRGVHLPPVMTSMVSDVSTRVTARSRSPRAGSGAADRPAERRQAAFEGGSHRVGRIAARRQPRT